MLLLGKLFFHLYLHWSYNVREIFYHLLLMRIYRETLFLDQDSNDTRSYQEQVNEEIRTRYKELLEVVKSA